MKSLPAPARDGGGLDRVDRAVQWLEEEWRRHGAVELDRLWTDQKRALAVDGEDSLAVLAELIKTDLRCRFARGQTPTVAGYLERFPELKGADSRVLSLIYEEFCLGEERGDRIDVESFCNRYPRWKDSLVSQLRYHRLFSQAAGLRPAPPRFPEPGEKFEEFELGALLGKGGTSRVFLARDLSLGGRQVVLKVSLDRGQEPQAQGALDHPHIVPVNSVVFGDGQLRGLSMPYRPGLPLDEIIKRVEPARRPPRAIALWRALVAGTADRPREPAEAGGVAAPDQVDRRDRPRGDGWEGFPVRGTYAQGAAWIALVLARALDHAHRKRTFHRDVKPGNVLLTLDHGPQLLDFNLAESPHSARQAEAAIHGGTLPYMAPEQIEAFFNPDLWGQVGAKADIYSLGLVLRELLTGQAPDLPPQTLAPPRAMRLLLDRRPLLDVSVRRSNPAIPHALEAIVAKCLAISPEDRYPDARALAEDLDRFLRHRPLVHAANPSRRERARDWLIRHRWELAAAAAGLVAAGAVLFRPAVDRLKTPIEQAPSFLAAVRNIEEGRFDQAEKLLRQLAWWYPESSLHKMYLSFALDGMKHGAGAEASRAAGGVADHSMKRSDEAEDLFRQAIADPKIRTELDAWGKAHPKMALVLESFGQGRFDRAKMLSERERFRNEPDPEKLKADMRNLYDLALGALGLAEELAPGSPEIPVRSTRRIRLIAIVEETNGNYQSAYELVSRSIDTARSGLERLSHLKDSAREIDKLEGELFSSRVVRGRIGTKWAAQLQGRGDPPAMREALRVIHTAITDLQSSSQHISTHDRSPQLTYYVLGNKAPALVTLGEIELELGRFMDAGQHLDTARQTIEELVQLTQKTDYPAPKELPHWKKRVQEGLRRLGGDEATAKAPLAQSRPQ